MLAPRSLPRTTRCTCGRGGRGSRPPGPPSCRRRPRRPPRHRTSSPPFPWPRNRCRRRRSPRTVARPASGTGPRSPPARSGSGSLCCLQRHHPVAAVDPERTDRARHGDVGAETLRLDQRVLGQLPSRDAGWEAEIVLDPRTGAGLPAGGHGIGGEHVEPFGRGVDRGGEAGRAGADHDEVVDVIRSSVTTSPAQRANCSSDGFLWTWPSRPDHDRGLGAATPRVTQHRLGLGRNRGPSSGTEQVSAPRSRAGDARPARSGSRSSSPPRSRAPPASAGA